MKVPISGGAATQIAAPGNTYGDRIAVDATSVYWTDHTSGMIMKAPK
jgi:hypothetical protein